MIALALLLAQAPAQLSHEVNVWVARNVAPSAKVRLNINTRNVPVVHVDAFPVDGVKYLSKFPEETDEDKPFPKPIGPSVLGWDVTVGEPGANGATTDRYFSRQVNLPLLKPGVYLLTLKGAGKVAKAMVNVTNLALVAKRSVSRSLTWVTDFRSGAPLPDAEVMFFTGKGRRLLSDRTDREGISDVKTPFPEATVVVRRGNDLAAIETTTETSEGKLKALFQTDRPIYRPGQTVLFKSVLRTVNGRGFRAVTSPVSVTVRDPRDNPIEEVKLTPNAMGSIAGSFRIPQEGMTGPYTLFLQVGEQSAYQTFSVAAYRKPEFKVDVQPVQRRYLAGETLKFRLNSAYYFGAPVPNAKVMWVVRNSGLPFYSPNPEERWFYGGDGNLYPRDTYASAPFAGQGEAYTDNSGNASIEIKSDPNAPDCSYQLDVTVEDNSRRQVASSAAVPVYAAGIRIGISSPQFVTALGGLVPVEVRAVDLDGRPIAAKVTLKLNEPYWVAKEDRYRDRLLAERVVQVAPTGKLVTEMPAKAAGYLRLDATAPDGTSRVAKASMEVYVAGPDYKPPKQREQPSLELKMDRRVYEPGQNATAYVSTNRLSRPILAVLEGRELFAYKVLPAGSLGRSWRFPLRLEMSPNAFVTATQWTEAGELNQEAIVPVPDASRQITVEAAPASKELHPGDKTRITIRTRDAKGRPVAAEVSLSVVDEAIYALSPDTTPDPYGFYWGRRDNEVTSTSSAPEEVSGGAYQRTNSLAPVRQRFEDTAYWNAFLTTDQNGYGTAEFEVPGNLTTWRATARGVTSSTQVGVGRGSFVATRDLTLRLATPRLMAQGDELTLIGTLNNRSSQAIPVQVDLEPAGVEATDLRQQVEVPARSERTVKWRLRASTVPASGLITLLARANGPTADASDALQVSVPVVPRGVRETTQSAGTMTKSAGVNLALPSDAMRGGGLLTVKVFAGLGPVVQETAKRVFSGGRFGSPAAADALMAAAAVGRAGHEEDVREAMALLSRTQHPDGWGWWDDAPSDAVITARVGHALALARQAGIRVFDSMWNAAKNGTRIQYDRTNLWEHRALLAAAMVELEAPRSMESLQEVRERGLNLSPYARLRMAEALIVRNRSAAIEIVDKILPLVSDGPASAFLPVGDGIGWTASEAETTAQLLVVLGRLEVHGDLQRRLVNRLAIRNRWYRSMDEDATTAYALSQYARQHQIASNVGPASLVMGDGRIELLPSSVEASSNLEVPIDSSPPANVRLERQGEGEVFYSVTLRYYRNVLVENASGVRVSRRFEVKNEAGTWTEVDRPIKPNEPVRCTVVVWGDDRSDAIRVTEPIPAGFEFVEAENTAYGQQDVRDGAVVHYMLNAGAPVYFRYFLRAEADGRLMALPAISEYLRRPGQHGQSSGLDLVVHP